MEGLGQAWAIPFPLTRLWDWDRGLSWKTSGATAEVTMLMIRPFKWKWIRRAMQREKAVQVQGKAETHSESGS